MKEGGYLDHIFEVGSCDIDVWGLLKPTSILNICQEAAYMHSTQMGFGFDRLVEQNSAWVLSRVECQLARLPKWHERVRVRTWHKRQSGIFSLRDYIFFDADDEPIVSITTSWLIINTATRRIVRPEQVLGDTVTLVNYPLDALPHEAERITVGANRNFATEHTVRYSDMDVNHHVNNAKYLEWVCDAIPQQMDENAHLTSIAINFNHEAVYNDVVTLNSSSIADSHIVIDGSTAGRNLFVASLGYSYAIADL